MPGIRLSLLLAATVGFGVLPMTSGAGGRMVADAPRDGVAWAGRAAPGAESVVILAAETSRRRARRGEFDARGDVACAQEAGETLGTCRAAVSRGGGGDATVVVTFANGFARQLYFADGAFVSASATMSGAGRDTDWTRTGGFYRIRVDDQRYEIPEGFVLGE